MGVDNIDVLAAQPPPGAAAKLPQPRDLQYRAATRSRSRASGSRTPAALCSSADDANRPLSRSADDARQHAQEWRSRFTAKRCRHDPALSVDAFDEPRVVQAVGAIISAAMPATDKNYFFFANRRLGCDTVGGGC